MGSERTNFRRWEASARGLAQAHLGTQRWSSTTHATYRASSTTPHQNHTHALPYSASAMSEERSKGISLRKKRSEKRPKPGKNKEISAPRQISAPMPTGISSATISSSARPSIDSNRSGPRPDASRERPQRPDKTADLVKRRYSQKLQLPTDFGNGELGQLPQIPSQYRDVPPSRDGRRPSAAPDAGGQMIRVDMNALRDPNLRPEQCM